MLTFIIITNIMIRFNKFSSIMINSIIIYTIVLLKLNCYIYLLML
jgi:hypothetical protein